MAGVQPVRQLALGWHLARRIRSCADPAAEPRRPRLVEQTLAALHGPVADTTDPAPPEALVPGRVLDDSVGETFSLMMILPFRLSSWWRSQAYPPRAAKLSCPYWSRLAAVVLVLITHPTARRVPERPARPCAWSLPTRAAPVQVIEIITEPQGHLHFGPPKTSAGRRMVGLPRFVVDALRERIAAPGTDEDLVFAGPPGGALRVTLFRRCFWLPAVKAAGLDGLRIHDLRHTAVALWIAAGANPKEVAAGRACLGEFTPTATVPVPEADLKLRERWTPSGRPAEAAVRACGPARPDGTTAHGSGGLTTRVACCLAGGVTARTCDLVVEAKRATLRHTPVNL